MRKVKYGSRFIEYSFQENDSLGGHYITVEKNKGVELKGKWVEPEIGDQLILKKARWIISKLELVSSKQEIPFVTGSRITYLGRTYYVEVLPSAHTTAISITFNHSKFTIQAPENYTQEAVKEALNHFYHERAIEKITPRVKKFSKVTGLQYTDLKFRKLEKSWGNCSPKNVITINPEAIKLPYSLIDYLIVHELCHIKVKDHSKQFWAELAKHVPNWKELNERVETVRE